MMFEGGYIFGHAVGADPRQDEQGRFIVDDWRYLDDGTKVPQPRACPKCNGLPTAEGHDPCLGTLPGVLNACCGHGVERGYIHFENGRVIRFDNAEVTE